MATGLQSLKITDEGEPEAAAAADALYETAEEVPWLSWLIEPGNVWVARGFVVGVFGYSMGKGVAAELAARKRPARPADASRKAPPEKSAERSGDVHEDMATIEPDSEDKADD